MSLPMDFPVVEVGDQTGFYQAWRIERLNDTNSHRGRIYPEATQEADPQSTTGGTQIRIKLFRNLERTELVAQGVGQRGTRIVIAPEEDYDVEVSVFVDLSAALPHSGQVVVFGALAGIRDIEGAEDRLPAMRLRNPVEVDFDTIRLRVMQAFYRKFQALFPPPVSMSGPLDFAGSSPLQLQGKSGLPDITAVDLWRMNNEGDYELVGLQNPGDYREWYVMQVLADIWRRKAGSEADPAFQKALFYDEKAKMAFKEVFPQVDIDRDGRPERPVRRRTGSMRRG